MAGGGETKTQRDRDSQSIKASEGSEEARLVNPKQFQLLVTQQL